MYHSLIYNQERPNQADTCGNRPPRVAFPVLPRLPSVPQQVDLDHWLLHYHHRLFKRRATSSGRIQIGRQPYFVRRDLVSRYVICRLDAQRRIFEILLEQHVFKTVPIKDLYNQDLDFDAYLELMVKEAEVEHRRLERERRLRVV